MLRYSHISQIIKPCLIAGLLLQTLILQAQRCEWLKTYGSKGSEYYYGISADKNDNIITCGAYTDTISIDTFTLNNGTGNTRPLLVKQDKFGNVLWVLTTAQITSSGFGYANFLKTKTDNNDDIYVTGFFLGTLDLGNSVIATSQGLGANYFFAKFNKSGTAQWIRPLGNGNVSGTRLTIDNSNNIYLGITFQGSVSFSGTTQSITSNGLQDIGIVKYTSNGNFIRATNFGGTGREGVASIEHDGSGNIYLSGYSRATFTIANKTLSDTGSIIIKTDSLLYPINALKFDLNLNNNTDYLGNLAVDNAGNCVYVNRFSDSVNFGYNFWLKSEWNVSGLYKWVNNCVVYFDSTLMPKWVRKSDSASADGALIPSADVFIKNDNIYFGGEHYEGNMKFGNSILNYVSGGSYKFYIVKMDTLGNVLWGFTSNDTSGGSRLEGITVDNEGDVIVAGHFAREIRVFDKFSIGVNPNSQNGNFDVFAAKISDYAIFRGYVSSGPYCAGDTLKVPYTKKGEFNIGNEFIAELSDSAGNFDGGHRELGRVTDTASGIIHGSLPLFNVATTNKYRIRIISTDPIVQSFYKLDTLRLLIYSKDSANAGPDRFVCKGQQITLGTTGGSRWLWTPADSLETLQDSSNRSPTTQPLYNSTEFRIIISDSSGCGDVDTDYVKINVRPYIETKILGDSQICRGLRQTLQAQVTGGDSSQYWYQWKVKGLNLIQSTKFTYFIRPANTTEYELIVGDSCSDKIDTSFFKVTVLNNLTAIPSPDTTICKGKTAQLSVTGTGCNSDKYTYEWVEKGNSTILSNNDSLLVSPTTTTQYQVILKDTSTLLIDTATIIVTVDSIFSISTTKDSTICQGQSINLTANVFSCDTSNMIYSWRANNNQLSTNNSITVSPTTTTTYTVIGENTFNGLKDTAQVTITVRDPLSLTINQDSTICIGEQAELRATATGGTPNTYNIQWFTSNNLITNNLITTVQPTTTTIYKAILSDGCTTPNDSAEITITVRPKLEITINQDSTICLGEQAELRATTTGGNPNTRQIEWFANNQQLSTNNIVIVNPTVTTTYKALLSDGCTTPNDSATITVTVRPKLTLTLNTDTTICVGEEAELRATATGGLESNHQIQWTANNQQLSTNNILKVQPTATTTYKAILQDNCTTPSDSAELTITVRPSLQLSTSAKDSICSNEVLLLTATPSGGLATNHNILWTVDGGLWTSNQNPATGTPQITTRYIATLTDNCSPSVQDTQLVVVLPIPTASFTATPLSGCPPLTVTVTDNSTVNDSTQNTWTIGAGEYQGTAIQSHELVRTGTYNIKLNVKNALGCSDEITQVNVITVFTKPRADLLIKPDIKEVEEPLQLFNLSQNAVQVVWDMGDGNIITPFRGGDTTYIYDENDTGFINAKIIAINNQGCRDTAEKRIRLFDKVNCTIPTAFTPNGDGLNNTFKPVCVGAATYTLTIYNRWGQVIYKQQNGAWDGTYIEQPVPMGVYMYKIQINAQSQKKKLTYGTMQLIR